MKNYYLFKNKEWKGPFSLSQLRSMWHSGALTTDTYYRQEDRTECLQLSGIAHLLDSPSVAVQGRPTVVRPMLVRAAKSRGIYIILGLFFGLLGVHNFYAGHFRSAVCQLLLNIFLFWTILVPAGIAVWVIIELITVTEDSEGQPLS